MKAFIAGIIAAAALAVAGAVILDSGVQRAAHERYQTEGVRL